MSYSILIVEDEIKLANLLADYFKQQDYTVNILQDVQDVVAWVKNNTPDVMLLDVMLPGGNGLELCKEIRQFKRVLI